MTQRIAGKRLLFGAALLGLGTLAGYAAVEPSVKVPSAHRAVEPVAPALPSKIVAAIQEGKFDDAVAALKTIAADPKTKTEDAPYLQLTIGVTQRISGKLDAAQATLTTAIDAAPKSPWAGKLRAELAAVELAAGRFDRAEQLARAETEALLADPRKDRLASVYREFARRLLDPESPVAPRDPEGAHALLEQARTLAKSNELRAELLLGMAHASQNANNHARALTEFQTHIHDYNKSNDRAEARFGLGEAQFATNQHPSARLTWTDLASDLEKTDTKTAQDLRARALDGIARTYGIPNPGDDASLNLGVAALKRLLAAYPSHPLAVQAAYQIGQAYLARGKSQDAIGAFRAFLKGDAFKPATDKAKEEQATLSMAAQFQIGRILQGQERFDEAIAAFQAYLSMFPNGPQSAAAQRAILDTRLLIAQDHLRHKQYAKSRAAWQEFLNDNPLDPRVPQTLFQIGESFATEKTFDEAITAWETLIGKFPGTEPAAHAQFEIASTYETEKGDPAEAIERFKKVNVAPWQSQARQRIAVMEAKALTVVTPRAFRSGETPYLKITTRNLEKLTFTAYKLNAESYFRKKHALDGVESLDIGLVQPDAEWTIDVPGFARFKPIESRYDLPKLKVPGVHVVKVTDETSLQATTLVLGSDLDVIVKASREQLLVFAQDMKTGKGRAGARVLIAGNESGGSSIPKSPEPSLTPVELTPPTPEADPVVRDETTGKDGVLIKTWDTPRDPSTPLHYLVIDGDHVAG
ncbi:MAG: tetratricopeptide repeat protein, partial [Isosphaeraceae bacterium]